MTAGFGNKLPIFYQGSAGEALTIPVTIPNGGTGATTKAGGFDALSPMTTLGDTIYGGAAGTGTRLAGNTTSVLNLMVQTGTGAASAAPAWSTPLAAGLAALAAANAFTGANTFGTSTTPITITQGAASSGSPTAFTLTGGAHTNLAASTNIPDININLARTVQFATGAKTTQTPISITAPTYDAVGATTISDAATVYVDNGPGATGNVTITKKWAQVWGPWQASTTTAQNGTQIGVFGTNTAALIIRASSNVETLIKSTTTGSVGTATAHTLNLLTSNTSRIAIDLAGKVSFAPSATASGGSTTVFSFVPANDTALTASTGVPVLKLASATRTWATTGTVASQADTLFDPMTYASASASQTFIQVATVAISNAPLQGTNAVITSAYSLWCQAGKAQFDGGAAFGLRADLKSYTVGTLPAAGVAGGLVYVSDAAVAPCVAFSNGTNWKRCDNAATTVV